MANFIPKIGLHDNLPNIEQGAFLITSDKGVAYVDVSDTVRIALTNSFYAVCGTAASTKAKVINDLIGFQLKTGVTVHVKFTYANSASAPTLNINGTGAKPIVLYGTSAIGTTNATSGWYAGAVVSLTYDGTSWVRDQGFNTNSDTTYSAGSGLTLSGTTFNHSNSIPQLATYPSNNTTGAITVRDVIYDAQGHITGHQDRDIPILQTAATFKYWTTTAPVPD